MAKKKPATKKAGKPKGKPAPKPAAKKSKAARKPGPRSQALPGMEQVRDTYLDNQSEAMAEVRASQKADAESEAGIKQGVLKHMERTGKSSYVHAGIRFTFNPGVAKLGVRVVKEEGDLSVESVPEGAHGDSEAGDPMDDLG